MRTGESPGQLSAPLCAEPTGPPSINGPAYWGKAIMIHRKLAISSWESKQPSGAQHKHQVRREAQVCQEGPAGAGASTAGAATWKSGGQKIFSSLGYESKKRGMGE